MARMTPEQATQLDHTSTRDHAAAIDAVLSQHMDEDGRRFDDGPADKPKETQEARGDAPDQIDEEHRSSRRKRGGQQDREADDAPDDASDDFEADGQPDEELSDDPEEVEGAADDEPDDTDDEEPFRTLADVADALEQPLDEVLANLTHEVTVNGEKVAVNLAEMSHGYMRDADYRRKTGELSEQRRMLDDRRAKHAQQEKDALAVQQQLMQVAQQAVIGSVDQQALAKLKATDPAAFIVQRDEIQRRVGALRNATQQIAKRLEQAQKEQESSDKEELSRYIQDQRDALDSATGGFSEDRRQALRSFLTEERGFADDEVGSILDHRLILIVSDLMDARARLSEFEGGDPEAKRQPEKAGRRLRRKKTAQQGRKRQSESRRSRARQAAQEKARKSGDHRDAAAAIELMDL